jgi:hypothetical protein
MNPTATIDPTGTVPVPTVPTVPPVDLDPPAEVVSAGGLAIELPVDPDPQAAAVALLVAIHPGAAGETRARLDGLDASLSDAVENARTDSRMALSSFLTAVGRNLRLRAVLAERLRRIDPADETENVNIGTTGLDLIRQVRRWRSLEEIRRERAALLRRLRDELERSEIRIRQLAVEIGVGPHLVVPQAEVRPDGTHAQTDHHRTGLVAPSDEFCRRAERLLTLRSELRSRLDRLDPTGDDGRAATAAEAVAQAGGAAAVAAAIAPTMPAEPPAGMAAAAAEAGRAETLLGRLDPESRAAAEARDRLARAEEKKQALSEGLAARRATMARELVGRALTGRLDALGELAAAVRAHLPALAEAIDQARGDDAELAVAVAELIGSEAGRS